MNRAPAHARQARRIRHTFAISDSLARAIAGLAFGEGQT